MLPLQQPSFTRKFTGQRPLTPQCALEETLGHAHYYGLPVNTSMPRTFVTIEIKLTHILNLMNGSIRQALRISEQRLLACDWRADCAAGDTAITQEVGRLAESAGLEAILVRSAALSAGANLIIFPENLRSTSRLKIVSPDKLGS